MKESFEQFGQQINTPKVSSWVGFFFWVAADNAWSAEVLKKQRGSKGDAAKAAEVPPRKRTSPKRSFSVELTVKKFFTQNLQNFLLSTSSVFSSFSLHEFVPISTIARTISTSYMQTLSL